MSPILAQTTTTFPMAPPPPTTSGVGAVVFYSITGLILIGALVLYLRHRRPAGSATEQTAP